MIVTVDDLTIPVHKSSRRKTLQLTVERDNSLRLTVPPGVDLETLETFVRSEQPSVSKKLTGKALMQKQILHKRFVQGKGFLYLGRHHRLNLVEEQAEPLKLIHGRFNLRRDALPEARRHFIRWYSQRGKPWLWQRVKGFASRLERAMPDFEERKQWLAEHGMDVEEL